jgi:hypothetical protein
VFVDSGLSCLLGIKSSKRIETIQILAAVVGSNAKCVHALSALRVCFSAIKSGGFCTKYAYFLGAQLDACNFSVKIP